VFVFRGRRRDLIKLLWYDGDGLCLFAKRLERGRFVWPQVASGTVALTRAQLCWFFRDSSCTPEADLHPLQMHRASVAPEPSDSARRGRARAIGACAGREVCGPLAVVSSVGSRVLGGCAAQVLRLATGACFASGERSAGANHGTVCDRERDSRPAIGRTPAGPQCAGQATAQVSAAVV